MKLDNDSLELIELVVETAQVVGIDNIIIEPGRIRGMDEERTVVLFQNDGIPEMSIGSIGLNRTSVFMSRLTIVKSQPNFTVEASVDEDKGFVRSLTMKAKGTKIEYRCANPATIQAPKVIHDELVAELTWNEDAVALLQKGVAAMSNPELINIVSDKRGVTFELEDINSDVFDHTFGEVTDHTFSHKYTVKTLLALFKKDLAGTCSVGQKGILRFDINGIGVFVLPKV